MVFYNLSTNFFLGGTNLEVKDSEIFRWILELWFNLIVSPSFLQKDFYAPFCIFLLSFFFLSLLFFFLWIEGYIYLLHSGLWKSFFITNSPTNFCHVIVLYWQLLSMFREDFSNYNGCVPCITVVPVVLPNRILIIIQIGMTINQFI